VVGEFLAAASACLAVGGVVGLFVGHGCLSLFVGW
jgi:hypothetical protein